MPPSNPPPAVTTSVTPEPITEPQGLPAIEPAPSPGQWFAGIYKLERVLGEGGVGIVFAARDASLERPIAIKVLRPELRERAELRAALLHEGRRLAEVRHPNVVTVHACGTHRGMPFVAMELVEGANALELLVAAGGRLPTDEVLDLLEAIARGLDALHAIGLVHGDLKPSNVLVGAGRRVKLIDVGLGGASSGDELIRGTAAFLAPERLRGLVGPSRAADLYAFGVTAYQLLTGHLPFEGAGRAAADEALRGRPPAPSQLRPELPRELDAILREQLMAPRPEQRPMSARAAMASVRAAFGQRQRGAANDRAEPRLRHIVVADDDDDFRELLGDAIALSIEGCVVDRVGSGDEALDCVKRAPPDAVILDLCMPGTPTETITRSIRSLLGGQAIPIVVLTGTGGSKDWALLREAGADACLLKPVEPSELLAQLGRHAARRQAA